MQQTIAKAQNQPKWNYWSENHLESSGGTGVGVTGPPTPQPPFQYLNISCTTKNEVVFSTGRLIAMYTCTPSSKIIQPTWNFGMLLQLTSLAFNIPGFKHWHDPPKQSCSYSTLWQTVYTSRYVHFRRGRDATINISVGDIQWVRWEVGK